jgi:hypothetical protein
MRLLSTSLSLALLTGLISAQQPVNVTAAAHNYAGYDRNEYPGDAALPALRKHFAFTGYWITPPPLAHQNTWAGKRGILVQNGFGFLVLANGKLEAEINAAKKQGTAPAALGQRDAANAVAAAKREGFPAHTIIFLDQEQGGRLVDVQSAYLFGWTEAVARAGYLPGVYGSGEAVSDGPGKTITTMQDIRQQVAAKHLHEIAIYVYQDACPPANGCSLQPPMVTASGTPDIAVWQYAQSPQNKEITAACTTTYTKGNCYAPDVPGIHLDLDVATSADPSHGR